MMERIEAFIRRASVKLAYLGIVLLLVQAFLILFDALGRWLFAAPIHGLEDVNSLMIVMIVASFFPAILIERQNIRATIMGRFLNQSAKSCLDVFGHLILFIFVIIISYQFSNYTLQMREQTTLILRLPKAPAMMISALLLIASAFVQGFVLLAEIRAAIIHKNDRTKVI